MMERFYTFLQMGGYAGFIWPAFIFCFVTLLLLLCSSLHARKQARPRLAALEAQNES